MFDFLTHALSGAWWSYALIGAVCAADAVLPLFPSETIVVTAAVLAANGRLNIVLVILAAAVGALAGDNLAYGIGRRGLSRFGDRLLGSGKGQRQGDWARRQLRERGVPILIIARFIPGGRTATTYIAGVVNMPYKTRFLPAVAVAAMLWALFSSGLGYIGGARFEHNLWLPLLIAIGVSVLVAGVGELLRRTVLK